MNKIALWIRVGVNCCTAELAIIAGNDGTYYAYIYDLIVCEINEGSPM